MKKVILYIAMSLDGYIADEDGNVDWLTGQDSNAETIDSYSLFMKEIDTVIMGWNTYYQIITELSPEEWVYSGLTSYVITHQNLPATEEIRFVNESPCDFVKALKQKEGKDIWICGGADIVQQLMRENLIERFHISVIPTILGSGIRLFEETDRKTRLNLIQSQDDNGITELIYELDKF